MLKKVIAENWREYLDFAFELTQNEKTASFPIYYDGIKTRETFEKIVQESFDKNGNEIFLFVLEEKVLGWIHYYYMTKENYIGFHSFLVKDHVETAVIQCLEYFEKKYGATQIDIGFPEDNEKAISSFLKHGFLEEEKSEVYVLPLANFVDEKSDPCVIEVTEENWNDFKVLHDQNKEMFWNSDRLYEMIRKKIGNQWNLYLYKENGESFGNIYFLFMKDFMEIFGMDFKEGITDTLAKKVGSLLLQKVFSVSKREEKKFALFFAENFHKEVAKTAGMKHIESYVLLRKNMM